MIIVKIDSTNIAYFMITNFFSNMKTLIHLVIVRCLIVSKLVLQLK